MSANLPTAQAAYEARAQHSMTIEEAVTLLVCVVRKDTLTRCRDAVESATWPSTPVTASEVAAHARLSNGDLAFVDIKGATQIMRQQPAPATGKAPRLRSDAPKTPGPKWTTKRGINPSKRIHRTPETIEATGRILLAHIKAHPGQRGEQIAAALKTTVATMRKPMKLLIAKKLVKTQGQRRGMTYSIRGRK